MISLLLRSGLFLTLLAMIPISLIRAQPYDDAGLGALLLPATQCAQRCWLGIQPRVTTAVEAQAILQQLEPVRELDQNIGDALGQIYWRWQRSSGFISPDIDELAYIWLENNVVRNVYLPGFRSFAEVYLALGPPEKVYIFRDNLLGGRQMVYLALYPRDMYVASPISCATQISDLLRTAPTIHIGREPEYVAASVQVYNLGDLRGWLPPRLCRTRTLR